MRYVPIGLSWYLRVPFSQEINRIIYILQVIKTSLATNNQNDHRYERKVSSRRVSLQIHMPQRTVAAATYCTYR